MINKKRKLYKGAFSVGPDYMTEITQASPVYDYNYGGLDLDPRSELHARLVRYIFDRASHSHSKMLNFHAEWREIDKALEAITNKMSRTEKEEAKKGKRSEKVKKRVAVPITFAILDTLLGQYVDALLSDTVFKYEPQGPEDVVAAKLTELLVQWQLQRKGGLLELHTLLRDAIANGIGAVHIKWTREQGKVIKKIDVEGEKSFIETIFQMFGLVLNPSTEKRRVVDGLKFEGNVLEAIDPYNFLPDISRPIHQAQDGEYIGFIKRTSYTKLMREEKENPGEVFNVRYLSGKWLSTRRYLLSKSSIYCAIMPWAR
jgi:hypothetical protein